MVRDVQLHIQLKPFVHRLSGDGIVEGIILPPESGTIIGTNRRRNRDREDDVDDERKAKELDNEHIAPPMQCEVSRDVFSFLLH